MFYSKLPIIFLSEIVSSKSDSTNGHIAAFILGHIHEVPELSIRNLAARAHVSPASISRFCRDIGLQDFNELKELAAATKLNFEIASFADTPPQRKDEYFDAVQDAIERVRKSLDMNKLRTLCCDIRKYSKVAVFGVLKAEGVAINLQTDLVMQGKYVVTKLPFSEQMDYLENADENDLIIIFSFTGIYFEYGLPKSFRKPKGKRPKIYFITSDPKAASSGLYNEVIWFDSAQNQASHPYQLQAVGSMIAQRYAHLQREEPLES